MIRSNIKRFLKEPLFHFLLIGFALFLLYDVKQGQESIEPNQILVSAKQTQQLVARFKLTKLRPPSKQEQQALIEDYVRDEVFYREAIAMGLDQNDPQLRKQMRMKLEYFLEELSTDTLTDEFLRNYLKQHPEKFQTDAQYTFQQLYINPDNHPTPLAEANDILYRLKNGEDPNTLGDRTLLEPHFLSFTSREIENYFGNEFSTQINQLNTQEWSGPISSSYGLHLIKIDNKLESYLPEFSDIRKDIEREYTVQRRSEQKDQAYQLMRSRYQVVVEPLAGETFFDVSSQR